MTTQELKDRLMDADETYPISSKYNKTHGQKDNVHWNNQKDHLLPWLGAQETLGSGHFTRKKINTDAKIMYSNLSCPECLLWLAEAAGVPTEVVRNAAQKAKSDKPANSRAASIRHDIPWEEIEYWINKDSK